jgi:type I restriction-modification system DNA methylase subunit
VLHDFEHFHILDCRYVPDIDTALDRALETFRYTDYLDKDAFRKIFYLFSRDDVSEGSIERYAHTLPKPTGKAKQRTLFGGGYQRLDEKFLSELDQYREELARAFLAGNGGLDGYQLTEVTQRTIDRLVFMRFLEDKLIETQPLVENLGARGSAWRDFITTSHKLDGVYNGIIFRKHLLLDSTSFTVDEEVFDRIRERLAHNNSPYDFNVIPIHILGNIYERFLGKVIVAENGKAKLEEKREVRKAGGVFYTPELIVNYIVENTVGKKIEGKTPEEIAQMRFADIACGSGSFLLGVYDLLLRYHRTYYNATKTNRTKGMRAGCIQREDGALQLSLKQKRQILVNNIYGVDLDPQAVEVAQLSLYLKLLEDETTASARLYQIELGDKLLPSLTNNIVCGNSLIAPDILDGKLFDLAEERVVNPMDFGSAFPVVTEAGGFDAIVGNPPYVRIQGFPREQIKYFSEHYEVAQGNFDLYVNFVERAFELLGPSGRLGLIVPNKFFKTDYGAGLRDFISKRKALSDVVDFGANQVFEVTTYTCLLFLSKDENAEFRYTLTRPDAVSLAAPVFVSRKSDSISDDAWIFVDDRVAEIRKKLMLASKPLLELPATMNRGSSTGDDEVFMVSGANEDLESEILRTPLFASDFERYRFHPAGKWRIIFPYVADRDGYRLYSEDEMQSMFPKAFKYLKSHKKRLMERRQYRKWFGYSAARSLAMHDEGQILVPLLADHAMFAFVDEGSRGHTCLMASGGFSISVDSSSPASAKYVLGLLNSRLLFWNLQQASNIFRGGWITCTKQYFGALPIHNVETKAEKAKQNEIERLVAQIIITKDELEAAQSDRDRNYYERRYAQLDREIDQVVYELYGLDSSEIETIEQNKI